MEQRKIGRESLGMWLDGAYGWHNTYRVIDAAVVYGFRLDEDDSRTVELYRNEAEGADGESMDLIADEATDYLQSLVTEDDLAFIWDAGELSLVEVDEEGEPIL